MYKKYMIITTLIVCFISTPFVKGAEYTEDTEVEAIVRDSSHIVNEDDGESGNSIPAYLSQVTRTEE